MVLKTVALARYVLRCLRPLITFCFIAFMLGKFGSGCCSELGSSSSVPATLKSYASLIGGQPTTSRSSGIVARASTARWYWSCDIFGKDDHKA
jgi:hypothetical protein